MQERLQLFLASEGLSAAKFAEKMEVGAPNISHLLSGRNKPGYDFIAKMLLRFPNLNPDWLLLGQGKMYRGDVRDEPDDSAITPAARSETMSQVDVTHDMPDSKPTHSNPSIAERIIVLFADNTFEYFGPRTHTPK